MLIIGLTGGIGSGKSTVARYFAELGAPVIDADEVARELASPGSEALREIAAHFGPEVINADGSLHRARLRALIFNDAAQRHALEHILHPRIYAEIRRRIEKLSAPYCVAVIPLLLETGQSGFVHRVLVVDSTPGAQRSRVQTRDGLSSEEITAIMASQATRGARLAAADDFISNDGSLADLRQQTEALHHRYLRLANEVQKAAPPLRDPPH